ncbi:MAG: phospholipase D-like domain-containing protein [Zestosphaera sp.]
MCDRELKEAVINSLENLLNCIDKIINTESSSDRVPNYYLYELQNHVEKIRDLLNNIDKILEKVKEIGISSEVITDIEHIKRNIIDPYNQLANIASYDDLEYRNDIFQELSGVLSQSSENLNNLVRVMVELLDEITKRNRDISSKAVFRGRIGSSIQKPLEELEKEVNEIIDTARTIYKFLRGLESSLDKLLSRDESFCDPEVNHISETLLVSLRKGLWAHKLLEILTGFKSVTGEPATEHVFFDYGDDESRDLSIDELLFRYPPFEPIAKPLNNITGNYVWFIKCKNTKLFIDGTYKHEVIDGDARERGNYIKIERIEPIDVLSLNSGEAIVTLYVGEKEQRKIISIKYGSRRLKKELEKLGNKPGVTQIGEIQKRYESEVRKSSPRRATYRVDNLSYVWHCSIGLSMSTDPYDYVDCPFRTGCKYGRILKDRRCPYWSNKRRIFPKVFPIVERSLRKRNLKEHGQIGFVKIVYDYGVPIDEIYTGVRWYMPTEYGDGISVSAIFEKAIVKELPRTNVVGLSIPLSLVRTLLSELLEENITPKPSVKISSSLEIPIDKLLYSKFFIWTKTYGGTDQFRLFQKEKNKLVKEYLEFINQIKNSMDKVIDYCIELFSHTLAHLLYVYLSHKLEIDLSHLIYFYKIDKEKDQLLILVAENSPHGVINIVEHIESKFNGLDNMVKKFYEEIILYLEKHVEEMTEFKNETKKILARAEQSMLRDATELNKYYRELTEKGLVLDLHSFTLHLVLSSIHKHRKISNEFPTRLGTLIRDYLDVYHCVDGCSSCTLLENRCISPLTQNLTVSRILTYWILKVLFKNESFRGTGKASGTVLLNQSKRKLFAVSPYLDTDGLNILINLAKRNVKVTLVTRHEVIEKFGDILKEHGIEVWIQQSPRHDKIYIIDDEILVESSWNLSSFSSINYFTIKIMPMQLRSLEDQILHTCRKVI